MMDFANYGYYYSDDSGSSQVFTYTFTQMLEKHKSDMEAFLNGFAVKEE